MERRNAPEFSEAWMSLAYTVAIFGSDFNWGAIISKQLSIYIQQAQTPKEGETPAFYMDSYLLDVMCTRNIFADMNLSWHVIELPVHIYFSMLWENRYKNLTPSFSMNSSHKFISFFLINNARDYRLQPRR
jgi:hypothetical protein